MQLLQAQCLGYDLGHGESVREGLKVRLLIIEDTDVCSLPRDPREPLEAELRGNDFGRQTSLKVDFPGGIQRGP